MDFTLVYPKTISYDTVSLIQKKPHGSHYVTVPSIPHTWGGFFLLLIIFSSISN